MNREESKNRARYVDMYVTSVYGLPISSTLCLKYIRERMVSFVCYLYHHRHSTIQEKIHGHVVEGTEAQRECSHELPDDPSKGGASLRWNSLWKGGLLQVRRWSSRLAKQTLTFPD
jgi:hypothetical protein